MRTGPTEDGFIKERIYKEIHQLLNPSLSTRSTSYELEDNIKSGSPLMNAVMWVWRPLNSTAVSSGFYSCTAVVVLVLVQL